MAKDPAFLFYTGDFSIGTQFFSDEQIGKYLRLLMAQHQHGRLTESQMLFICKSKDEAVFSKFKKDESGLYYNVRLETEANRRKSFSESRSKNKAGKTKKENITSKSYDKHMENKNENKDLVFKSFNHLSITISEVEKLKILYSESLILEILERIENYKDNSKYTSLYLTAKSWLKKEPVADNKNKMVY